MKNNMPPLLKKTILIGWIWAGSITGFNLSQTMFPPTVDTTPVFHMEKEIIKQQTYEYDKKAIATAYTLSEDETDSSPCIGAGNHNLCEITKENPDMCIVATRLYPLHTKLQIEGIDSICEVLDRTSKKYGSRIDILMDTKAEAFQFGKKEIRYRLINNS